MKINLRWPEDLNSNDPWNPWFVILWRLFWSPLIYGGKYLTFLGILAASGLQQAKDFLENSYV